MITDYTYLITDTLNDKIESHRLKREVNKELGLTIKLIAISYDSTNIKLKFADALPGTQEADYLDGIVAAHTGRRLKERDQMEVIEKLAEADIKTNTKGKNFTFTKQTTTHVYCAVDFTYLRGGRLELDKQLFGKDDFDIKLVNKGATPAQDTIKDAYFTTIPVSKEGIFERISKHLSPPIDSGLHVRVTYRSDAGATDDVVGALTLFGKDDA